LSAKQHRIIGRYFAGIPFMAFLLCLAFACTESKFKGYTKHKNNFYFKLIQIGENKYTPQINDFLTIAFTYRTVTDSLFFSGKSKIQLTTPDYSGSIDNCFATLCEGDSTSFIVEALPFFSYTLQTDLPSFLDSVSFFKVDVKLISIQKYDDYVRQKKEFLAWVEDFGEYEKVFLQHYIEEKKLDTIPRYEGYYKVPLTVGEGATPEKGDTVFISYNGRFLNGNFFDTGKNENQKFEFVFGTEWQVLDGVEKAIRSMKEGEKSLIIMPSNLAFGAIWGGLPPNLISLTSFIPL